MMSMINSHIYRYYNKEVPKEYQEAIKIYLIVDFFRLTVITIILC